MQAYVSWVNTLYMKTRLKHFLSQLECVNGANARPTSKKIILPYMNEKKQPLDLEDNHPALAIFNVLVASA